VYVLSKDDATEEAMDAWIKPDEELVESQIEETA
jgi:hypothetical protein